MLRAAGRSLLVNLLYALYHGVLGLRFRSLWFVTMWAYYTVLGVARAAAVLCGRRGGPADTEYFVMRLSGGLLALLSLVLSGVVYVSLSRNVAVRYGEAWMIAIDAYTFGKLGITTVRAIRQRRDPAPLPAVLRNISYAEVAASMLTLQRSMLVSFDGMEGGTAHAMNAGAGAAVCGFVLWLGLRLIRKGRKGKKHHGKVKTGESQ